MSLPKFNLSKLKEAVSRQQKVTRQDIRNLLLLDRLQAEVAKQDQVKKPKDKSGEKYKITIIDFKLPIDSSTLLYNVVITKYVGEKSFSEIKIEDYDIEEVQTALSEDTDNDWDELEEGEDFVIENDGVPVLSQKYANEYMKGVATNYTSDTIKSSTLLNNLEYFEKNFLLENKDENSWSTETTEGNDLFGVPYWDHILHHDYDSIEIERL